MKKALAEPVADRDARLSVLTKAMSENKEAFDKVHTFIFRTCACSDSSIDKDYLNYMKPHRTCYGLMNTLRVVNNNECEQLNKVEPGTDMANDWTRYFGAKAVYPNLEPQRSGDFDKVYGSLIDQAAVKSICNGTPPVIVTSTPPEVVVTEPDKSEWICETTCKTQPIVATETTAKTLCTITKAGWSVTKKGTTEPVFTDASEELTSKEFVVDDLVSTKSEVGMKDDKKAKQECPVTVATEVTAPTCSIVVIEDGDVSPVKATVTIKGLKEKEEAVVVWTGGTATKELPNEILVERTKGADKDISVTFTIKGAPVVEGAPPLTCPGIIPMLKETDPTKRAYEIKATAETALAASEKINAVVKIDSEDKTSALPAGFKISWTRKGDGVAKLTKTVETKEVKTTAISDGDGTTTTEKPVVPEVKAIEGEAGTGPSITETRVAAAYESCATLIDDKGAIAAGPSCAPVPALAVEKTNPYQKFQQPAQQQTPGQIFMFQPKNTAAGGIN